MYISNNGKFKEGIIWWDTEIDHSADVDVYFFIHDYKKRADLPYGFKTLEIDLKNKSNERIFSEYSSSTRQQLKKIDSYDFNIVFKDQMTDDEIKEYVKKYNEFANFKKLQNTSYELIKQMVNDKKLIISELTKNGQLIVSHSHYVATGRARLYQSFSTNNEFNNNINSVANRALTHYDIINFKKLGLNVYDFGGIGNVEGDNSRFKGIIWFKKQFGGLEKILWKGISVNGLRGKEIYEKYWK